MVWFSKVGVVWCTMLFGFVWRSLELYGVVGVVWCMNKGGKFLKKLWCCVGGRVHVMDAKTM